MEGWVKIHRQIQENILWSDKPFSKGQAWIDLLIMANYADGEILSKGAVVHIKRGQVFRTQKNLADRWGWSIKKVRTFITLLETQKMATSEGIAQGTLITIENYSVYQDEGQAEALQEDIVEGRQRAVEGRQKKKNKNKDKFTPPTVEEVRTYCIERNNAVDPESFVSFYESKGWMVGANKMKDWKAAVRTWERKNDNGVQNEPRKLYG